MELLINSLLFQIHAVETFSRNKESKISGIDNQILMNIPETKLKLLSKLKHFKNRKPLPFKRVYIYKKNNGKWIISILCLIDRLIQQLFVLVLNPFIEANSDFHSYGFRKSKNQSMLIGAIQKNLQSKLKKNSKNLKPIFI
jgi:retron-type reverse transcriptase